MWFEIFAHRLCTKNVQHIILFIDYNYNLDAGPRGRNVHIGYNFPVFAMHYNMLILNACCCDSRPACININNTSGWWRFFKICQCPVIKSVRVNGVGMYLHRFECSFSSWSRADSERNPQLVLTDEVPLLLIRCKFLISLLLN